MARSSHEREHELFDACLGLTPPERASYLERTCRGDPELQQRVERLLAAHGRAEGTTLNPLRHFLDTASQGEPTGHSGRAGESIGPYRLLRPLAEGGMGSVWLAERSDGMVQRPIALKLPRGAWQGAQLGHPHASEHRTAL
jgi:eukaryotic-like serine/threonine-protein kinase